MTHKLVDRADQAIENIKRYQTEVRNRRLINRMKQVHAWYAVRSADGKWLFAPSKFIGYANNNANTYLSGAHDRYGARTEAVLREWFEAVRPTTRLAADLNDALREFLVAHGHSGPRKNARICIPREIFAGAADIGFREVQDRIHIDAAICGGRPHIRGTRVRVSDILDLLANGVSQSEILADYPYLSDADLSAALAFGAAASAHRVILAA